MKRLLAVLLVVAMLCSMALAAPESHRTTLRWQVNENGMKRYVDHMMKTAQRFGVNIGFDVDETSKVLASLMNATELHWQMDTNGKAVAFDMAMRGIELINLVCTMSQNNYEVRSDMMPGMVLTMHADPQHPYYYQPVQYPDAVWGQMLDAAGRWLASVAITVQHGAFDSNTYVDGDTCITYDFDDAKLTELVSALEQILAPYIRNDELMESQESLNRSIAAQNAYSYQLRVVKKNDEIIGVSVNCSLYEDLVLTLSASATSPYQLVACYMDGSDVIYDRISVAFADASDAMVKAAVDVEHYVTDGSMAFVLVTETMPLYSLHADVDLNMGKYCTIGTVKTSMAGESMQRMDDTDPDDAFFDLTVNADFVYDYQNGLNLTATTYAENEVCWTTSIQTENASAIQAPVDADEERVDLDNLSQRDLRKLEEKLTTTLDTTLTMKLFKALPPELLMYLIDMSY